MALVPSCANAPFAGSGCICAPIPTHPPCPPATLWGGLVSSLVFPSSWLMLLAHALGSCWCSHPHPPPLPPSRPWGEFGFFACVFPRPRGSCWCRVVAWRNAPRGNSRGIPVLEVIPSLVVPAPTLPISAPQFACGKVPWRFQQESPDGDAPLTGRSAAGNSTAHAPPAPLKGGDK